MKPLQGNLDFFLISESQGPFRLKNKTFPVLRKMKFHYKNLCYTISWVHVFIQQVFDNGIVKIPELGFAKDKIHCSWIYCH